VGKVISRRPHRNLFPSHAVERARSLSNTMCHGFPKARLQTGLRFVQPFLRRAAWQTPQATWSSVAIDHISYTCTFDAVWQEAQTARRLCTPMLRSWHKTLRSTAFPLFAIYWPDFPTFTFQSPIWRPQWGGLLELSALLQSIESRMMIDSAG